MKIAYNKKIALLNEVLVNYSNSKKFGFSGVSANLKEMQKGRN